MKNKEQPSKTLYCTIFPDCAKNNLRLWECPSFLFLITGIITIAIMIATYFLTNVYTSTEFVIISVIAITVVLVITGFLITQGVGRITEAKVMAEREKKKTLPAHGKATNCNNEKICSV